MEILLLIARIIFIIINGANAINAVSMVAKESGKSFETLWDNLPSQYK